MLRVFVVDDEPLARKRIIRILENLGCELVGEAESGQGCLQRIQAVLPDLVFLDIEMPAPNGIEIAQQLKALDLPVLVIFLTAHAHYALEAYRAAVAGYLLKPVDQKQVSELLQTLSKRVALNAPKFSEEAWISCQCGNSLRRIAITDVLFLQAEGKYIRLFHVQGEALLNGSINEYEHSFPQQLLRVHRRSLVNRARLLRLDLIHGVHWAFLAGCSTPIEVSRRRIAQVKQVLQGKPEDQVV